MADTIGTAYVQIEPSFEGVVPKIDQEFGGAGQSGGNSFTSGFGKAMKGFGVAAAAAGAAIGAIGAKFVSAASDVATYGDQVDKESQKMGISSQAYQEWSAVLQHTGGDINNLKPALKTLSKEIVNNSDAFQKLGISQQDIIDKPIEDVLATTITKLQEMDPSVERTRLATQLLGRSSVELGALLNTSAAETQAMKDRVHELGGVMSDEAVKASAAFQDQLQDMKTAFQGVSRNLTAEFLPSITKVMEGLTEIFSGDSDKGIGMITEGLDSLIDGIMDALPQIVDAGTRILESLIESILENLPKLMDAGFQILDELVRYILDNLDLLIKTGLDIIVELALGIAKALPELIPTMVETIITITEYLIDNVDMLIDASIAIIMALAEGLIKALPRLIEKAPEIIMKLFEAIIRNVPKLLQAGVTLITTLVNGIAQGWYKLFQVGGDIIQKIKSGITSKLYEARQWGSDMIQNFINGITSKFSALIDSVKRVARTVKSFLGFSEPEVGPLSNFHTYAPDMMKLYAEGIEDNIGVVKNALTDATAEVMGASFDMETIQNIQASADPVNISQDNDRLGRIETLLMQFIDNFKQDIYLDTGALVGGTVNLYNNALGQLAIQGAGR